MGVDETAGKLTPLQMKIMNLLSEGMLPLTEIARLLDEPLAEIRREAAQLEELGLINLKAPCGGRRR